MTKKSIQDQHIANRHRRSKQRLVSCFNFVPAAGAAADDLEKKSAHGRICGARRLVSLIAGGDHQGAQPGGAADPEEQAVPVPVYGSMEPYTGTGQEN